jgi:hypothetical protein
MMHQLANRNSINGGSVYSTVKEKIDFKGLDICRELTNHYYNKGDNFLSIL